MNRLSLLALLLASSSLVAAPAPFAKPQRKPELPKKTVMLDGLPFLSIGVDVDGIVLLPAQPAPPPPQKPAQPRNADPPG